MRTYNQLWGDTGKILPFFLWSALYCVLQYSAFLKYNGGVKWAM